MFEETAHVETAERSMRGELIITISEIHPVFITTKFQKDRVPWTCQKTNETRVVCSGDMEEDANSFEFQ